ncbi:hypothetical protein TraAM80_09814 [Trypanosoma rangeli]|uniref:Uncharacterized protein n=1 Tax=Trypanosoma rangeli TaxID=5698 RepID=A0A422MT66_TRYRA|nr:uncharacterized protein TraAM80_09814 [Trypanosoma rangeli]RNE96402.1 hypothetical protein TraAM80_09814 [Trypanosoma rangeli]|eukprot:RNE96402.1 hypothetical protein TraAM80_09814 [Trypanosoma rangeli]
MASTTTAALFFSVVVVLWLRVKLCGELWRLVGVRRQCSIGDISSLFPVCCCREFGREDKFCMLSGLTGGKANAAATTAQRSGTNRIIVIVFVRWRGVFFLGAIVFGSSVLQWGVPHAPLGASSKRRWRLSFVGLPSWACMCLFRLGRAARTDRAV